MLHIRLLYANKNDLLTYLLCMRQIRNEFYSDTQGVLLVFDVTNRSSFEALDSWLEEMKRDVPSSADFDNAVFIVCANKVFAVLRTMTFISVV